MDSAARVVDGHSPGIVVISGAALLVALHERQDGAPLMGSK